MPDNDTRLILASTSPYRRELLQRLGIPFDQEAPGTEEGLLEGETPEAMVARLAREKAQAVAARHDNGLVIGSDQCAVRDGEILGKPGSRDKALQQLAAASGLHLRFLTAACVVDAGSGLVQEHLDVTTVKFRDLDPAEIERYVDAENPLDCAGSFKSEGLGITLFEKIDNEDPSALMGLPLIAVARLLRKSGLQLP